MDKSNIKENVKKSLLSSLSDPIVNILLKNSNFTKIQLETLLIDILVANLSIKTFNTDDKAKLRLLKGGVSRGSFNRTLRQARKNVIQSIYTILLLGYLGIFENSSLDPFLEVANKLQTYINAYKDMLKGDGLLEEHLRLVNMLREELEDSLNRLSEPRFFREFVTSQITP